MHELGLQDIYTLYKSWSNLALVLSYITKKGMNGMYP